jgi:hypothetical protein
MSGRYHDPLDEAFGNEPQAPASKPPCLAGLTKSTPKLRGNAHYCPH